MPPKSVSNSRRPFDSRALEEPRFTPLSCPRREQTEPGSSHLNPSGPILRHALSTVMRSREVREESLALARSAHRRTQRREATRVRYEAIRAERKRLIFVRWEARQARYGRLHVVAELPPGQSRIGDPSEDIPVDAVFTRDQAGFDGQTRAAAIRQRDHQAFVTQTLNDAIHRLYAMSLDAASARSISSEQPVRERLQRLISEADTTISALSRAQVILDAAARGDVDLPE